MSFKVKYFFSGNLSFFLFAILWQGNFKLEKLLLFAENLICAIVDLIKKGFVITRNNFGLWLEFALFGSQRNIVITTGQHSHIISHFTLNSYN